MKQKKTIDLVHRCSSDVVQRHLFKSHGKLMAVKVIKNKHINSCSLEFYPLNSDPLLVFFSKKNVHLQ